MQQISTDHIKMPCTCFGPPQHHGSKLSAHQSNTPGCRLQQWPEDTEQDHEMTWCLSWSIIMFLFCSIIRDHSAGIPYQVPFSNTPIIGSKLQGPLNQLNPDPSYASRIRSFELARLLRKAQPRETTTPLARKQRCRMMLV